jgi:tetratricopeptide (TPR) repeat protein
VAEEAAAFLDETEALLERARAHFSLAVILRTAGRTAEAVEHAQEAVRLYEQKGAVVPADSARALLAELSATVTTS